jgi:PiT family inorganic phosphate transporter
VTLMTLLLLALAATLSFANGSNDNGKGVATLVGYGAATPRPALLFATLATALGGGVSFFLAGGLLKGFSGGWLFDASTHLDRSFYAAVLIGACVWVLFASRVGLPVSTTHAIIGALCGAGWVAYGLQTFQWSALGMKFAVPLALSPVLALAVVYAVAWPVVAITQSVAGRCICVTAAVPVGAAVALATPPEFVIGTDANCPVHGAAIRSSAITSSVHWLSCGLISFARGWNDTPKIAALSVLALAGQPHGGALGFGLVTVAMAAGGMIGGRRVLETLSAKLTPLPLAESLTSSMATAMLVGLASWNSLPVSTTHVATGAIIGAGLKNDPAKVHWTKVGEIVLSWIVTLPVAAIIAAVARLIFHG